MINWLNGNEVFMDRVIYSVNIRVVSFLGRIKHLNTNRSFYQAFLQSIFKIFIFIKFNLNFILLLCKQQIPPKKLLNLRLPSTTIHEIPTLSPKNPFPHVSLFWHAKFIFMYFFISEIIICKLSVVYHICKLSVVYHI